MRAASFAVLALFAVISNSAWALLPFPFFDPFGFFGDSQEQNEAAVNRIVSVGMDRPPAGVAPFGLTPSGEPLWPVPEPQTPEIKSQNVAQPSAETVVDASTSGSTPVEKHNEKINSLVAKNSFVGKDVRPLINSEFLVGSAGGLPGRPQQEMNQQEVKALQHSFLYDLQRHARFVYEGKNELAAAVAHKWKLIGTLHSNQIDEITFNIAAKNNFPRFLLWIEAVIEQDMKFVGSQ